MTGRPQICVSLAEPTVEACRAALARTDCRCAEIRLDKMQPTVDEVRQLFSEPRTLMATCRPGEQEDGQRGQLLLAAIEGGASYVDIELGAPLGLRRELFRAVRAAESSCQLIVSVHELDRTPPATELAALCRRCFDAGADLAKIACWVDTPQDGARLLGLLDRDSRVIVVGLGPRGRLIRIVAPLLGSPLAYAAQSPGQQTGPGQLDRETLEWWLEELGRV